jgi:hypothetical protein
MVAKPTKPPILLVKKLRSCVLRARLECSAKDRLPLSPGSLWYLARQKIQVNIFHLLQQSLDCANEKTVDTVRYC